MSQSVVSPLAIVEDGAELGAGCVVHPFSIIQAGAVIGENCLIGSHVFIERGARIGNNCTIKNGAMIWEGVEIGDQVFIGPGVLFTNDKQPLAERTGVKRVDWLKRTRVASHAVIGAGAVILPECHVGSNATVGAGAVVVRPVWPATIVVGNPAESLGSKA